MVRDADSSPKLRFVVQLVEPEMSAETAAVEVQYLRDDLQALSGLSQTRIQILHHTQGEAGPFQSQVPCGVEFEAPADRLRAILRRLCDRLNDYPQETTLHIDYGAACLQVQTHQAKELALILEAAETLVDPQSAYLAKAKGYSQTQGEFSPAEEANLDLLRQRLGLTVPEAETLKAIALGPYKTREAKRQHFSQVLMEELTRQQPLREDTWELMLELADNLNLLRSDAEALYQSQLQDIQVQAEAIRQQQQAEAEAQRRAAEDAAQRDQHQEDAFGHQQQVMQYRELVRQVLQAIPYPPPFDQGRLEQARQLWKISTDDATHVEEVVRSELYGDIASAMGADYSRLRQLLWSQQWQEADRETENVLLKALHPKTMEPLDRDAILQLPCVDLMTIDQLWGRYSGGRFGFKAQHQVYLQVERRPADFLSTLGWRGPTFSLTGGLKPYNSLEFHAKAPPGHLPTWRWCCPSLESGYDISETIVDGFFLHLDKCLSVMVATPTLTLSTSGES